MKKEKNLQEEEKKIISQKKVLKPEEYKKKVSELRSNVSKLQKERKNLLDNIILYYKLHIENFVSLKSLEVLRKLF